jgi:hypothetical protein
VRNSVQVPLQSVSKAIFMFLGTRLNADGVELFVPMSDGAEKQWPRGAHMVRGPIATTPYGVILDDLRSGSGSRFKRN